MLSLLLSLLLVVVVVVVVVVVIVIIIIIIIIIMGKAKVSVLRCTGRVGPQADIQAAREEIIYAKSVRGGT